MAARKPTAEICLYGNGPTGCGSGWLAHIDGISGFHGTGEPKVGKSFTECVWDGLTALRGAGVLPKATVRVFMAGGQRVAFVTADFTGYFGDLKWEAAPVYEVPVEALLAASTN